MSKDIKSIIKESIEKVVIEYIVEQVIKRIDNQNKKALVVFTGATIGFEKSIAQVKRLKEEGWELEVVLSKSALSVLKENSVKEYLGIDNIIKDNEYTDTHKLVEDNTLIIVPTLTVNSCSKVVNCISDNVATNIISYSLMLDKKVVASIDGCCPDNDEREKLGKGNFTDAHKEVLRNNLNALKNYGVVLTRAENINYKVSKIFNDKYSLFKNTLVVSINNKAQKDEVFLDKKIISRLDIYENKNFENIKVNKNSIITDLANEEAIRLKINLLKI